MRTPADHDFIKNHREIFVSLTARERDILRILLSKPVVKYSDFNALLQPRTPKSNPLNVHVHGIRKKLLKIRSSLKIKTLREYGFVLEQ